MDESPLNRARDLILSITTEVDAKEEIAKLELADPASLNKELEEYYNTAVELASAGDTKGISRMLRVFEHFGDKSHDRMLLHYVAQAEANKALKEGNPEEMRQALALISQAFTDADAIDAQIGQK
ncbi:hypothetical protein HY024_01260 [Candidatus Curtissbacteria bacterium]|nr:hypothetical protein [Candidatus Curtissbacteria bacterium]